VDPAEPGHRRLLAALEKTPLLDLDMRFVLANSAYADACGHTRAELIGRNHFDLFPNEENEALFNRVRDTGRPVEFKSKPTVARHGDNYTITFETQAACDVTVAIEDDTGRILRHFASGVLGPKAPPPFKRNTLKQSILWDGKDDQGKYLDAVESLTVDGEKERRWNAEHSRNISRDASKS